MDLVITPVGGIVFAILVTLFLGFSWKSPQGALSIPSVSFLTTMVYFFVLPLIAFGSGSAGFLGVQISSMTLIYVAALLYALGVAVACAIGRSYLFRDPVVIAPGEVSFNPVMYYILLAGSAAGIAALFLSGQLRLGEAAAGAVASDNLRFLHLSLSALLPLTLVYVVRTDFKLQGLLILGITVFLFLIAGFRFRLAILMVALVVSYCLIRRIRIGVGITALGVTVAMALFNAISMTRTYGSGLDLSRIEGMTFRDLVSGVGGEIGPVFALHSVITVPPPYLAGIDPWVIALSRLVPKFIWADKPYPDYLGFYTLAFDEKTRMYAGIAGTQHAEAMVQFGWPGLFIVPFIYFTIAMGIVKALFSISREARIAGFALLPGLLGFYMQQRGYFFQNMIEIIAMIGPLFLMHVVTPGGPRRVTSGLAPQGLP